MERAQPAEATVVVSCTTRPTSTRPAHNPKSKYAAVSESLNDKKNAFIPVQALIEIRRVTETLNMRERKVRDMEGRDYSLRVRPYRTADNKIDGAVLTLVDLEGKKESYARKPPHHTKQVFSHK
jgi:hypothetical protein